tara:strand:+ start:325 stop:792 length:468 start_codon:yes stop_codon:yes gene_type:complete
MANFNSTLEAGRSAKAVPTALGGDRLDTLSAYATYELDASENVGDTLTLFKIPANAIVIDFVFVAEAHTAAVQYKIGDSGDDDRLLTAFSAASAVAKRASADNLPVIGHRYTSDTSILATFAGADPATITGTPTVHAYMTYIVPHARSSFNNYID